MVNDPLNGGQMPVMRRKRLYGISVDALVAKQFVGNLVEADVVASDFLSHVAKNRSLRNCHAKLLL